MDQRGLESWMLCLALFLVTVCTAKGPPRIVSRIHHKRIAAREGRTIKLTCPVEADPPPILQWIKDSESIHDGWERYKSVQDGLRIKDVMNEDAGHFICRATNGFGTVQLEYQLYVFPDTNDTVTPPLGPQDDNYWPSNPEMHPKQWVLPHFTHPSQMRRQSIMRPVGSSIRLKCKASGKPKPSIRWYKDGRPMTMHESHLKHAKWTLKLRELQKDDSGKYLCRVANIVGSINFTYEVEVVEKIKEKPVLVPPHPLNMTVMFGGATSFQCKVKSAVQPHIQWLKRVDDPRTVTNVNTTITVKGQQFVVLKTGRVWPRKEGSYLNKLQIPYAQEKDAGMYICLGANSMGYSIRSAFLRVLKDPRAQDSPASRSGAHSHSSQTPSLPLIVGLPAGIVVIIFIVAVYLFLQRRRRCMKQKTVVRQPAAQRMIPPNLAQDKPPDPYGAVHSPLTYAPQQQMYAPSRERIIKQYPDIHSNPSSQMSNYPDMHHSSNYSDMHHAYQDIHPNNRTNYPPDMHSNLSNYPDRHSDISLGPPKPPVPIQLNHTTTHYGCS